MTIFSKSNIFKVVVIFLLWLVTMFGIRECKRINKKFPIDNVVTSIVRDTTYLPGDSVLKNIPVKVNVPIIVIKEIPAVVDTQAILKDYFALKIYNTIIEDTTIKSFLTDSVSQNKIVGRKFEYQLKRGPMVITNTITNTSTVPTKTKLFIGAQLVGNDKEQSAIANIGLLTKKDHGYLIGYNPFEKKVSAGVLWKIKLRK